MDTTENPKTLDLEPLVAEIVSGYVRKNHVAPTEVSVVINVVYQSLLAVGKPFAAARTPAVPISQSSTRKFVVCLDCGWRGQTLNRHLRARHGLKENEYRTRWGLPLTHRLTATVYSEKRSAWAKKLGLGRPKQQIEEAGAEAVQVTTEPPSEGPGLTDNAQ
jgi:predicted transcriptional regulator